MSRLVIRHVIQLVSSQRHGVVEVQIGMVEERCGGRRIMMWGRLRLYQVQVQIQGRDVGRIMVVKVVKAKVVTCRVGQSETRVPRIAAACRVCRVRRRWETCEQRKTICQLSSPVRLLLSKRSENFRGALWSVFDRLVSQSWRCVWMRVWVMQSFIRPILIYQRNTRVSARYL